MQLSDHELLLLTKAVDGLLSQDESTEFHGLIAQRPDIRREYESLKSVREVTMELKFKHPPAETWDRYWAGVYARLERGLAWLLISIGAAVVLAVVGYNVAVELLEDSSISVTVKIAIGALVLGGALLLVSVLREKLIMRKTDKYKEVKR
jgi:hypothetical protein